MLRLSAAGLLTSQIPLPSLNAGMSLGQAEPNLRGKIVLFGVHVPGREHVACIQSLDRNGQVGTVAEIPGVQAGRVAPDGSRLALVINAIDNGPNVWVMNADASHRMLVVEDATLACWSSDGKRIAFYRADKGRWQNFTCELETNQTLPLNVPRSDIVWDWSPDGTEIAFRCYKTKPEPDAEGYMVYDPHIVVMNGDGSDPKVLLPSDAHTSLGGLLPDWR